MFPLVIGIIVFVGLSLYCWWIEDAFAEQNPVDDDLTNALDQKRKEVRGLMVTEAAK